MEGSLPIPGDAMNGMKVRCIKKGAVEDCRQGEIYKMVNIGECYAIYNEEGKMLGTVNGRTTFNEYFKIMWPKKNTGKPKFRKKKRKGEKKNNGERTNRD